MADADPPDRFEQARQAFLRGLACHQEGDDAQAERHYLDALALLPGRASTLINLAATRLRLDRPADALASADAALAVEPEAADAWLHRGSALAMLGHAAEALQAFEHVLRLVPDHPLAWSHRGSLLRELQRPAEAAAAFREAIRHGGDAELNRFFLAGVGGDTPPPAAPAEYVRGLFDGYAAEFDEHLLGQLHYQAHERLVQGLRRHAERMYRQALDLGCGTGLCAPLLRPLVRRLVGVDLSPGMLARSRERGLYDELVEADVTAFLGATDLRFDLVVATDVFIYIGDLEPLFDAVRRRLDRGVFAFSVEAPPADGDAPVLLPSLRYAQPQGYLRRLARAHGLNVLAIEPGPVRQEQQAEIAGAYVYLTT